ncbi:MAG: hypothetical protein IPL08_16600 [Saprospiraceae bacterium]|nr:hypothetical protein [Saprospiraceae bacterium]
MATLSLAFHPGQMVQTRGIFDACCEHLPFFTFVRSSIARHLQGDWGDEQVLCKSNEAIRDGFIWGNCNPPDCSNFRMISMTMMLPCMMVAGSFLYIIYLLVFMVWSVSSGSSQSMTGLPPRCSFHQSIEAGAFIALVSDQGYFIHLIFSLLKFLLMRAPLAFPSLPFDPGTIIFSPGIRSALVSSTDLRPFLDHVLECHISTDFGIVTRAMRFDNVWLHCWRLASSPPDISSIIIFVFQSQESSSLPILMSIPRLSGLHQSRSSFNQIALVFDQGYLFIIFYTTSIDTFYFLF